MAGKEHGKGHERRRSSSGRFVTLKENGPETKGEPGKPAKPGQSTPRSGKYQAVGSSGGKAGQEIAAGSGMPLPPAPEPDQGFDLADADQAEDLALRRQAEAIAPGRARLDALIDRLPPSSINYDDEDDEPPC
jgi:hypothetical protein